MSRVDVGVVITVAPGRESNLARAVGSLRWLARERDGEKADGEPWEIPVSIVYDGWGPMDFRPDRWLDVVQTVIPKHAPGQEQPRNVGVRRLRDEYGLVTHAWFLDSDMVFHASILDHYEAALREDPDRILIGPYDWLAPGAGLEPEGVEPALEMPDPRWASFREHPVQEKLVGDLGAALACFGGNLMWPVDRFTEIGGFHPELHHGRCEDGELGLRAASAGVPMSFVAKARAWHVWHAVNVAWKLEANRRDVPLLNKWHPWVEEQGLVVSAEDGARFNWHCPRCGAEVNSLEYWTHNNTHPTYPEALSHG